MNLKKGKNICPSYFYYSLLFIPPFLNIFLIQINIIFLLFIISFGLIKRKIFKISNIDSLPLLLELLIICYSFYFVPKIIKYFLFILLILKIYLEFFKDKVNLNLSLNKEQILILITYTYSLFNTFANDILVNKDFNYIGYIQILGGILIIIIGLFVFSKYNNIKILIRPIFFSALMHIVINLGYLLNLTNDFYLKCFSQKDNFIFSGLVQGEVFAIESFRTNAILLFVIPTIYFLYKKRYFLFFLSYFALAITGSKSGFIFSTLGLSIWLVKKIKFQNLIKFRNLNFLSVIISLIIVLLFVQPEIRDLFNVFHENSKGFNGLEIRLEYLKYYFNNITLPRFLLGFGNNYEIYNSYRNIFDKTEISQLNFLYYSGFINSFLFYFAYFKLIINNFSYSCNKIIYESNIKVLSIILIYTFMVSFSQVFLFHPVNILILIFISKGEKLPEKIEKFAPP